MSTYSVFTLLRVPARLAARLTNSQRSRHRAVTSAVLPGGGGAPASAGAGHQGHERTERRTDMQQPRCWRSGGAGWSSHLDPVWQDKYGG